MSLNAPCTTRSPIAGISEQADLPTVVRKLDLARSRTPTAFRGPPGYAGSGACPWLATRPTTNVYTRIIWLRRPEQDATPGVIRRPGAPRLAFALAVALIRHAVPPRDCGT